MTIIIIIARLRFTVINTGRGSTSDDDQMSTYFRAVSRSGRGCPRLRCGEHGSSCPAGTSPVFSTDEAGCPICTCRQLTAFLRPSTTCPPLDCSHLVCVGPVRFSSRLVGHCPVCECVPVEEMGSTGTVTPSTCPDLHCSDHIRCHGGRKFDPQTGCETCECVDDDCASCAEVCASAEPTRCSAVCRCDVNGHSCRPLPTDCEFRAGCVLEIDADGCEVCQCAVAEMVSTIGTSTSGCPQITCPLTCDGTGYAVDENGCRVCACASTEAETTTTTTPTTTKMVAVTDTSCVPVDCVSLCPEKFDIVKDDNGCDACVCMKAETVSDHEDDVTKPSCDCTSSDCSNCKSSTETDRQNDIDDDATATKCEPMTQGNCDVNCVVATDDAGCPFCLCDDRESEQEIQTKVIDDQAMTEVKMTTVFAKDDVTSKKVDDACEHLFVCHPICQTIRDSRGCVAECRCDDVVSSLADMQQEQQQLDVLAESEQVMCTTADSVCSCDVDEEELWTVGDDGCLMCVCVMPSATTNDISHSTVEDSTSMTATTPRPSTSPTTDTTTQMRTSTITTVMTTMISTSQQEVTTASSTIATSSVVGVECRQLADGDCAGVTCGKDGYAKDEDGCDVCSCAVAVKEEEPTETVYHVVATARKGTITRVT